MLSDLLEINFYFPIATHPPKSKEGFIDLIMKSMRQEGTIKYAGYAEEKILRKDLARHIGDYNPDRYRGLTEEKKRFIEKTIRATIQKCHWILPLPTKNFIFVFPWFPSVEEKEFNGSFGSAAYSCVFHLFIAPDICTAKSIADSVAHEINHTISYFYHFDRFGKWSLLDHIINEGLAENFREEVLRTKPSPWSVALTEKEAFRVLDKIKSKLNSRDQRVHQEVLWGNGKHKRWTGYSIGYWIIKRFRKKNPKFSWKEIMQIPPEDILVIRENKKQNIERT